MASLHSFDLNQTLPICVVVISKFGRWARKDESKLEHYWWSLDSCFRFLS